MRPSAETVRPRPIRRTGFTLIELLLVVMLLGMVAGLAVPRLAGLLPRLRVEDAGQQIVDAVRTAQTWATDHGGTVLIEYDMDEQAVRLKAPGTPPEQMPTLEPLPRNVRLSRVRLSADSEARYGTARVPVYGGGFVRPHQVELVEPQAGRVTVNAYGTVTRVRED